ncbi:hypothetical protein MBLNU230_g7258t1 [Neophaeotheca triangularis]
MPVHNPNSVRDHFVYDAFLWFWTIIVDLFFREIHPRSSWKVPRSGPVIFVAAPHANQFVDPLILMRTVRQDARRRIAFLIAEKSMRRKFIGWGARLVGSVSVGRALDSKKPAKGLVYLPDPEGDPALLKGKGTNFTDEKQYQVGGLIVLPSVNNQAANAEIAEIIGPEELRLKKPFKGQVAYKQLTGKGPGKGNGKMLEGTVGENEEDFEGTKFDAAPHVDQSAVYDAVFEHIKEGGCIGIFPEGGSHDRTELLPLKAGLAIMALGALAQDPNCGVTIVPVGMNYFHAHKFRSRAVIEFGSPVSIEPELVEMYKSGNRRDAIAAVLQTVYDALVAVTVTSPDYDTLMLIQAVRRLYNPKGKKLPLPMIVELNRRLVKGYQTYKDDPRIINLKKAVLDYNRQLFRLGIRDHQLSYAKFSWYKVVLTLIYRVGKLLMLSAGVLPGLVLFAPVFIVGKMMSIKKAREALAASSVKVQARDVMATWKILISLAFAPTLYTFYTVLLTWWTYRNRVGGRVPDYIPIWLIPVFGYIFFPAITFAALRFGEIGMDIFKSLRPLVLSLNPSSSNSLVKLRARREWLVENVTDLINELGPELFPDFDHQRIVSDPNHPLHSPSISPYPGTPSHKRDGSGSNDLDYLRFTPASPEEKRPAPAKSNLPRNDSFKNIGNVGLFASRPGSPNRSRSRSRTNSSDGMAMSALRSLTSTTSADTARASGGDKADMDEVSRKIQSAMRERGRRRNSEMAGGEAVEEDGEEEGTGEEDKKAV